MKRGEKYPGLDQDPYGGMTDIGRIILDAKVFGLIPESETCAGWEHNQIEALYEKVHAAWNPYGHMVSRLPEDMRQRHARLYGAAVKTARELGWTADLGDDE